ncbi:ABC transporter substrate-binding protein [Oscillospiraceae bacterium HV4-5-C5C]|nr:ABC transporter substrate-binding protein [Oscillospiraceae bacterium HV4-5-C5C]
MKRTTQELSGTKKKTGKVLAGLAALSLLLTGCQGQAASQATSSGTAAAETTTAAAETSAAAATESTAAASSQADGSTTVSGASFTVGVIQFAEHGSLDNCYQGLIQGLADNGYVEGQNLTVDLQNANADTNVANQMAQNFVSKGYDLIVGIATPAAQAAYNAAKEDGIPVLFTAVTDPVAASLQNADGSNLTGVTGTSDALPVESQLKMIRAMLPDAKTIGILYNTSETNSVSAVARYEELADQYGFTIESKGVASASEIPMAADAILRDVDCLSNLTDNLVVQNLPVIVNKADAAGIPYFGSEVEQVVNGCVAAEGLDYVSLGNITGQMGAEILSGARAEDIPVSTIEAASFSYNSTVLEKLGLSVPADYAADATDVASEN